VHDGSRILRVLEGTKSDELRKDCFHVEAAVLSISKGGDKWTAGFTLAYLFELNRIEARALQESSPTLLLSGAGERLVLGGEHAEVLCLTLCSAQRFVGGQIRTFVSEHAGEHVLSGPR
jgi:hypothetical protein